MFFTYCIRVFAIIGVLCGLLSLAIGIGIATEFFGPYEVALKRYGGSAGSSGEMIDNGLYFVLVGAALGALAEISFGIRELINRIKPASG